MNYLIKRHGFPVSPVRLSKYSLVDGVHVHPLGKGLAGLQVMHNDIGNNLTATDRALQRMCRDNLRDLPLFGRLLATHERNAPEAFSVDFVDQQNLHNLMGALRPKRVVEIGSGISTLMFNSLAQELGYHVTSLEGDPRWFEAVSTTLQSEGIGADLRQYEVLKRPGVEPSLVNPELFEADFIYLDGHVDGASDCGAQIIIDVAERTGRCPNLLIDCRIEAFFKIVERLRVPMSHASFFVYLDDGALTCIPGTSHFTNFFIPSFELAAR